MGVHDHEQDAATTLVTVHVIVVSTSRAHGDPKPDRTGPAVVTAVEQAGHQVTGPQLVPDDTRLVAEALDQALKTNRCVLLCGGTGVSARDLTPEVVKSRLSRELPGFGELFRALSFHEVGPAAMLSRALGGVAGANLVFALPGSPNACDLALTRLILPNLKHLVHQLDKEPPLTSPAPFTDDEATIHLGLEDARTEEASKVAVEGLDLQQLKPSDEPTGPVAHPATGWQAALIRMGGEVLQGVWPQVPEAFDRVAPARNVLEAAGELGVVELGGRRYGAFGFPDLRRSSSKVLLVAEGEPWPEVFALHRQPKATGICVDGDGGLAPSADLLPDPVARRITGQDTPSGGRLFAVEGDAVYLERDGRVYRWDGRREREEGRTKQVLASLMLRWSQR